MAKFSNEQDFVNEVLAEFARRLIEQRQRNVRREKAIAKGTLLDSYEHEIRKATVQQTAMAMFAFEERGRWLDMKRVNRKGAFIPVEVLKEWIKEVGLEKFKQLPGQQPRFAIGNQERLNQLAWGISRSIRARGRTKKVRRKLQTGTESLLQELIGELRDGFLDRTVEQIKDSLQNSFK